VSIELAIGTYPEPSQIHTFEADFCNILLLFSSNVSSGAKSFISSVAILYQYLYCPSRGILLFYVPYFIATAIMGTKENSDAIYYLDSPINSSIFAHSWS
jgi:hypothetical protein